MKLNAPKQSTFLVALVLVVVGILAEIVPIAALAGFALWLVVIGFVVLALGTMFEGL